MTTIQFRPNAPQWKTLGWFRNGHTQVWPWGRGVGKTRWHRENWWRAVAEWDYRRRENAREERTGVRIIVLFPWLKQFADAHGSAILDDLNGRWSCLGGKVDRRRWQIWFPGGSWIMPFPAQEHSLQVARSMRCDIIDADEIDDIPPSTYEAVAVPWLSEPWSLHQEWLSGTPKRGRHGLLYRLHRLGLDPSEPTFHTLHATYIDSPETVDITVVERARKTADPTVFKREWLCDFDAAEGLVYGDLFDEALHIQDPPSGIVFNHNGLIVGLDHGYEHPGAALLIGIAGNGDDATAWVLEEVYERHRATSWWADRLKEWATRHYPSRLTLYADPSQPQTIEEYRGKTGMWVPSNPVDNNVDDGISAVASRLLVHAQGENRVAHLYVSPRCVNTIREFGLYRYKPDTKEPDMYQNTVEKRNDHAMDALRYAVFNGMSRPGPSVRRTSNVEDRQ